MYIVVLIRAKNSILKQVLVQKINETRRIYVSCTVWENQPASRIVVPNWQVDPSRDLPNGQGGLRVPSDGLERDGRCNRKAAKNTNLVKACTFRLSLHNRLELSGFLDSGKLPAHVSGLVKLLRCNMYLSKCAVGGLYSMTSAHSQTISVVQPIPGLTRPKQLTKRGRGSLIVSVLLPQSQEHNPSYS